MHFNLVDVLKSRFNDLCTHVLKLKFNLESDEIHSFEHFKLNSTLNTHRRKINALKLINSQNKPTGMKGVLSRIAAKAFDQAVNIIQPDFVHALPQDLN